MAAERRVSDNCCAVSKYVIAMGTKLRGGSRNDAAACVGDMSVGSRPGGRDGVRRLSGSSPGDTAGPAAYGFVIYDASDVTEGIGSRSAFLLARRLRRLLSLPPFFGDLLVGRASGSLPFDVRGLSLEIFDCKSATGG